MNNKSKQIDKSVYDLLANDSSRLGSGRKEIRDDIRDLNVNEYFQVELAADDWKKYPTDWKEREKKDKKVKTTETHKMYELIKKERTRFNNLTSSKEKNHFVVVQRVNTNNVYIFKHIKDDIKDAIDDKGNINRWEYTSYFNNL